MERNYTNSYTVFSSDLGFFESSAIKYKEDALKIKNGDFSTCSPSFHLLSSLAFELFPKVLLGYDICLKYKNDINISEDDIRKEILDDMRVYMHNLDNLYNHFPDLLNYLSIEKILPFQNINVWEYRIKLKNNKGNVILKDIEAIRYGAFAKNRDIATFCGFDNEIIILLNKLEKYVQMSSEKINNELKVCF